jgi:hypothetical protein
MEWKDRFNDGCEFYERFYTPEFCAVWDVETGFELLINCAKACKTCAGPEPIPDPIEDRRRLTAAFPEFKFRAGVLPSKNDVMNYRRQLSEVSATIFV